jgi:F0F1-type ATP synthase assembly protein I
MARDDCSQCHADDMFADGNDASRPGDAPRVGARRSPSRGIANFIGGTLVGIAVVLPALLLDLAETHGGVVLLVSLLLGFAGIAMFAAGANANADRYPDPPE